MESLPCDLIFHICIKFPRICILELTVNYGSHGFVVIEEKQSHPYKSVYYLP